MSDVIDPKDSALSFESLSRQGGREPEAEQIVQNMLELAKECQERPDIDEIVARDAASDLQRDFTLLENAIAAIERDELRREVWQALGRVIGSLHVIAMTAAPLTEAGRAQAHRDRAYGASLVAQEKRSGSNPNARNAAIRAAIVEAVKQSPDAKQTACLASVNAKLKEQDLKPIELRTLQRRWATLKKQFAATS